MKHIIFLAMSTLPSTIQKRNFNAPDGTKIIDCRSQLEPVVRYILKQCGGQDVYIMSMATTDSLDERIIKEELEPRGGVEKRVIKVKQPKTENERKQEILNGGFVTSAQEYFQDRIEKSEERKALNDCLFSYTVIDLHKPEEAIQESVKKIKSLKDVKHDDEIRLWIDTHGGIRDVAVLINVVGYLLQEFEDFDIAGIYGTETSNNNIIDQKNAFYSLAFVSGMSDFMNFGNVDVLKKYYQSDISGGDKGIRNLINAMQMVSDGTQFCDPYLYKEGLDALSIVIESPGGDPLKAEMALLPIFYDNIKKDYGILLDKERRSDLDIVERCMKKKQYQQALTFVEALMPQYFFDKQILYFSDEDLERAKLAVEKSYKSAVNTAFDSFMERVKNVFSENDIRNSLVIKAGIFAGITSADGFNETIRAALENAPADITSGIKKELPISKMCSVGKDEKTGEKIKIKYETKLQNYMPSVARVMQMHNILKNSRNKFNHAVESNETLPISEQRPELNHVVKVLGNYISEIRTLDKFLIEAVEE